MGADLRRRLSRLERLADADVILVGWVTGAYAGLDPDRVAAHEVRQCAERVRRSSALLVITGRGGTAAFADSALRALRSVYTKVEVLVLEEVSSAGTLLALGADRCLLGPLGALGAYDAGPSMPGPSRFSPREFDDVPAMGNIDLSMDPGFPARLAHHKHEGRVARNLAERWLGTERRALFSSLSVHELGDSLALDLRELSGFGFEALPEAWRASVAEIAQWCRDTLRAELADQELRYTASGIGEEVEFEAAAELTVACVASSRFYSAFVVDSGRPHPDTGIFLGTWLNELAGNRKFD